MSVELYLAYVVACFVITIIPGPTVTLIVANSLTHGTRAGLLNMAGTQLGLGLMMLVLVVGLSSIIATMGYWFDWLRFVGAAYLIWLGWKLLRSSGGFARYVTSCPSGENRTCVGTVPLSDGLLNSRSTVSRVTSLLRRRTRRA